jgi:REP element-mobilizing transposase RayT
MSHQFRGDAPDTWHHALNRGIARRTIFETRADVRFFLSLLARMVRRGWIEVHAYCVMSTHFHLLVRSPVGRLSEAMQWIEENYVRWFNRSRRRDGPLFRGRFRSFRIESNAYWSAVLAYIDCNPIEARIAPLASAYPWGSATHYARAKGPRWLCRERVEALLQDRIDGTVHEPTRYDEFVACRLSAGAASWVARCMGRGRRAAPDMDDLVAAAPDQVRAWMQRKARLADGTAERTVAASPASLRDEIERRAALDPGWVVLVKRRRRSAWAAMRAGLLRHVAGARLEDVARWEGVGESSVRRREGWHRAALQSDERYAATAAQVAVGAIKAEYGESGELVPGSVPPLTSPGR